MNKKKKQFAMENKATPLFNMRDGHIQSNVSGIKKLRIKLLILALIATILTISLVLIYIIYSTNEPIMIDTLVMTLALVITIISMLITVINLLYLRKIEKDYSGQAVLKQKTNEATTTTKLPANDSGTEVKSAEESLDISATAQTKASEETLSEDEKFMLSLKAVFHIENENVIENIENALENGDIAEAHRHAHTLKSSAAMIGKQKLSEIATAVESQLKNNENSLKVDSLEILKSELAMVFREFVADGIIGGEVESFTSEVAKKNSILIVDDDRVNIRALELLLGSEYKVYTAEDGRSALTLAKRHLPDLILLDIVMPDIDGYEVLFDLRMENETKGIPVMFLTGISTSEGEKKALKLSGVVDYISKPFDSEIVKLRVSNHIKTINDLRTVETLSNFDTLTDIPNRRSFNSRLEKEWAKATVDGSKLSLIMADIDDFKKYNDAYGHLQGDEALKIVAKVFSKSTVRKTDMVARWGGEEFVVLLPETELDGALNIAERIRKSIEEAAVVGANGEHHRITVSLGVTTARPSQGGDIDKFVENADEAHYVAKRNGKNRIEQILV